MINTLQDKGCCDELVRAAHGKSLITATGDERTIGCVEDGNAEATAMLLLKRRESVLKRRFFTLI
jgi:hypothetical protein